jgi:hypothetical protein
VCVRARVRARARACACVCVCVCVREQRLDLGQYAHKLRLDLVLSVCECSGMCVTQS